jgi:hypothetical protein
MVCWLPTVFWIIERRAEATDEGLGDAKAPGPSGLPLLPSLDYIRLQLAHRCHVTEEHPESVLLFTGEALVFEKL